MTSARRIARGGSTAVPEPRRPEPRAATGASAAATGDNGRAQIFCCRDRQIAAASDRARRPGNRSCARDVLIRAGAPDDVGKRLLRRLVEDLRRLDDDRRLRQFLAVGFAADFDHVLFERRQAVGELKLETVPAGADPGIFKIGAITIGEDAAEELVIVDDKQADRDVRLRIVLRPPGDLPQIDLVKASLQHGDRPGPCTPRLCRVYAKFKPYRTRSAGEMCLTRGIVTELAKPFRGTSVAFGRRKAAGV